MQVSIAILMLMAAATRTPQKCVKPPPLQKGDTIALVAPAGAAPASQIEAASANIEKRGFKVRLAQGLDARRGYLAGHDKSRAAALNAAIRDPEVKAILCLRGGYGSPRILDQLDYEALKRQPKIIIGYSDITALLLAVREKSGLVAFHGPMGREWSLGKGISPYAEKYFWDAFAAGSPLFSNWGGERPAGMKSPTAIVEGSAEGRLTGGNLSLISSLMGTPYEIDTRGGILFLEEVQEKPFRIDRMLNQLRLAGKLKEAAGILLGAFTGCDAQDPEGDLSLSEVFLDYFASLGVPVLTDFPAGHVADQATLPMGVLVRLDATAKTLTLLESPVAEEMDAGEGPRAQDENAER